MYFWSKIWNYEHIPKKWIIRLIGPILKKGNGQYFGHDSGTFSLALNKNHTLRQVHEE